MSIKIHDRSMIDVKAVLEGAYIFEAKAKLTYIHVYTYCVISNIGAPKK